MNHGGRDVRDPGPPGLQRRMWTLDDVRAVGHWTDETFAEAVRSGAIAFSIDGREIRIGNRHYLLGGPCRVCGLPTGVPEPLAKYEGIVFWTSHTYCTQRCAQRAYRGRKRKRLPRVSHGCAQCGEAIPEPRRSDTKFCSNRCRQASYRQRYGSVKVPR